MQTKPCPKNPVTPYSFYLSGMSQTELLVELHEQMQESEGKVLSEAEAHDLRHLFIALLATAETPQFTAMVRESLRILDEELALLNSH